MLHSGAAGDSSYRLDLIDRRRGAPALESGAERNGVWTGETALMSHDGHEIPVLQVIIAHKSASGAVDYFSTVMRDITERKEREEVQRASHAKLQQAYSHLEQAQQQLLQSEKIILPLF